MQNESSHPDQGSDTAAGTTRSPDSSASPSGATNTRVVKRTRTAGTWIGLILGIIILILLLIFIVQNPDSRSVHILAWSFELPLGVSMLFAAIAGALVMALVGGARILQLRKAYRKKPPRR